MGLIASFNSLLGQEYSVGKYEQSVVSLNRTVASFFFNNFFLFVSVSVVLLSAFRRFLVRSVELRGNKQRNCILHQQEYKRVRHYAEFLEEAMKLHRKWLNQLISKTGIDRSTRELRED